MSHSQRQKKRAAQFRKKHFDAKGRGQGERKKDEQKHVSLPPSQPQQPQTEETEGGGGVKPELHQPLEQDKRTDHSSKFSRRKVASNWERYADSEFVPMHCDPTLHYLMVCSHTVDSGESATYSAETEDQLQMRLVQLLNLPQALPDLWTPEEEEEEGAGVGGNFLSLNITQLAESLKDLPTHTRLALPAELLQHYGVSEEDLVFTASEVTEHADSTTPPPSTSEVSPPQTTHSSNIDLKSLLSKNSTANPTFDFSTPNKEAEGGPQTHSHTVADEDLEELLKTSSHLPTSHKAPLHINPQPWPSAAHGQPDETSAVVATQRTTVVTEELDNMLDDLLA